MSDKPWTPGKRFRELTAEQYAAELMTPRTSDARAHAVAVAKWEGHINDWGRYVRMQFGAVGAGMQTLQDATRLIGQGVEIPIVAMGRMAEYRSAQFLGDEYNSNVGKTYRWNNADSFRPFGAFVRGMKDSFMGGKELAKEYPDTFGEGAPLAHGKFLPLLPLSPLFSLNPGESPMVNMLRAAVYAKKEMDNNFPWQRTHPDEHRNNMLDDVNPLWIASPVADFYRGAKEAAHIEALTPVVQRMMDVSTTANAIGDMRAIALQTYGRDLGPATMSFIKSAAAAGEEAGSVAKALYSLDMRAPGVGKFFQDIDLSFVPKFFKRGGEGVSTAIRDFAYSTMKTEQKLSDHFRNEINLAGQVGDAAATEVTYLLSHAPRPNAPTSILPNGQWDTGPVLKDFEMSYQKGVMDGSLHEVSPKALEYAKQTIHDTTIGWLADSSTGKMPAWNPLLAPSKEFAAGTDIIYEPNAGMLSRPWMRMRGVAAEEISGERLALWRAKYKTHEQITDVTNGAFAEGESYKAQIGQAIKSVRTRIKMAENIANGKMPSPDWESVRSASNVHAAAVDAYQVRVETLAKNGLTPSAPLKQAFDAMVEAHNTDKMSKGLAQGDLTLRALGEKAAAFDKELQVFDSEQVVGVFTSPEARALKDSRRTLDQAMRAADGVQAYASRARLLDAQAIVDAGPRGFANARMDLVALQRQHDGVDQVIKDFKSFTTTTDYLAELKKAEPVIVGRLLTGFDKALSYVRRPQLMNWGTIGNNAIDTNFVKNAIFGNVVSGKELGEAISKPAFSPRYGLLGEDLNEKFTTDVAHYAYDSVSQPEKSGIVRRAAGAVEDHFADYMNRVESSGRIVLGRKTYEAIAGKLIDSGADVESASKIALTEAMRFVDLVHVDYANLSPLEKIVRRATSLYPRFNINDVVNYTGKAINNGTEAYALTQVRAHQQENSIDGKGSENIGGLTSDFLGNLSPFRVMETAVNAGKALTGNERLSLLPFKAVELAYGSDNPLWDSLQQAAGVAPSKNKGSQSKYDSLVSNGLAALSSQKINLAPGDIIGKPLGFNPATARDAQWSMQAQFEQAVALRQGRILEFNDAKSVAQMKNVGRALLSIVSPVSASMLSTSPVEVELMGLIRKGNDQIAAASPEHKDAIKDALLAQPEYRGLKPFLTKSPGEALAAAQKDATFAPIMSVGAESIKNPESMGGMTDRALTAVGATVQNVAHLLVPSIADAPIRDAVAGTESPSSETQSRPSYAGVNYGEAMQKDGFIQKFESALNPKASINPSNGNVQIVLDPAHIAESMNASGFLNVEMKARIMSARSDEEAKNIIDAYGTQGKPALRMVAMAATVDGDFWRPVYEGYLAAQTGGAEGGFREAPRGAIASTRAGLGQWYQSVLHSAPASQVDEILNWTVPQAQARLGKDILAGRGPVGIDYSKFIASKGVDNGDILGTMSPTNLALLKAKWDEGSAASLKNAKFYAQERALQQQYPEFGKFVGMLQDAERPGVAQAKKLNDAIDFGAAAIKAGTLPPDVYQQINDLPRLRDTYQRVENAAMVGQTDAVWDHITFKRDGKVIGINPVAVAEMATSTKYSDWVPALQQIASGMAGDQKAQWLNSAVVDMDPAIGARVSAALTASPKRLAQHKTENFEAMTGQIHPDLSALIGDHRTNPQPFLSFISRDNPSDLPSVSGGVQVAAPGPLSSPASGALPPSGIVPVSERPQMQAAASPINFSYQGPGAPGAGIANTTQFMTSAWTDYSVEHAAWASSASLRGAIPEPSFSANIAQTWKGMEGPGGTVSLSQARVGVAGLQVAYQLASIGMAASGEEMPPEVSGSFAGLSTGMSIAAAGGFTPPALVVGAIAGIATGFLASKGRSQSNAYNEANVRINQQRLDLERERYAESLKQQDIRNIRTRESDLARSLGGLTPAQRTSVGQQLQAFQRRPTFQSRIGLVDAAERAVGSALKPRW